MSFDGDSIEFTLGHANVQQVYEKMFNIIYHLGNVNRIQSSEINAYIYSQLSYKNEEYTMGKGQPLQLMAQGKLDVHMNIK